MGDIRLFVSHAHKDGEIATAIVDLIETALVRDGGILCTSHRSYGYKRYGQIDVSAYLREHLSEASCVVALLTPYTLESQWCMFELGGAWARATRTYPLVAGGVTPAHMPAAFEARPFGKLDDPQDLRRLLSNLRTQLTWDERNMEVATGDQKSQSGTTAGDRVFTIPELIDLVKAMTWPEPPAVSDLASRFSRPPS